MCDTACRGCSKVLISKFGLTQLACTRQCIHLQTVRFNLLGCSSILMYEQSLRDSVLKKPGAERNTANLQMAQSIFAAIPDCLPSCRVCRGVPPHRCECPRDCCSPCPTSSPPGPARHCLTAALLPTLHRRQSQRAMGMAVTCSGPGTALLTRAPQLTHHPHMRPVTRCGLRWYCMSTLQVEPIFLYHKAKYGKATTPSDLSSSISIFPNFCTPLGQCCLSLWL